MELTLCKIYTELGQAVTQLQTVSLLIISLFLSCHRSEQPMIAKADNTCLKKEHVSEMYELPYSLMLFCKSGMTSQARKPIGLVLAHF